MTVHTLGAKNVVEIALSRSFRDKYVFAVYTEMQDGC